MIWSLVLSNAFAHKPSFGGSYTSSNSAYEIVDPDISIVVYQEVTCEKPELWMTFDVDPGYELYVQLGVPVIDRLFEYYPSVAIVAKGFPDNVDVPFDLPDGKIVLSGQGTYPDTAVDVVTGVLDFAILEYPAFLPGTLEIEVGVIDARAHGVAQAGIQRRQVETARREEQ